MAAKMAKQLAGSGTGQSLMDRVTQAKYSLAGSALGKVVAKASTEEMIAPKKKHLENLTHCSNEPNVSIPLLVNFLSERTREKSWVVVFKALITTHHLLNYGNEKISQYMASNNSQFHLPHFNDKSSSQSYEMSLFIRKYSKYLAEKTRSYQMMAFDFCKVKRGKDDGVMRTMPADKLLKALPVLQDQLSVLFEFEATQKDLNNFIINAAFILLYKDLIRLFASYNEGMMNLVEKFFTMKRSLCRTALALYREFPNVMTQVDGFLTVAESLGIGEKESMGLHPVPPQVLDAMEKHLALLSKKKCVGEEDADGKDEMDEAVIEVKDSEKKPTEIKGPANKLKSPSKVSETFPTHSSPARPPKPTVGVENDLLTSNHTPLDVSGEMINDEVSDRNNPSNFPATEVIITNPDGTSTEALDGDQEVQQASSNDEEDEGDVEGLSTEQQQAVIAAATCHFSHSADSANQAVKQSAALTPQQTRKSRTESGESTKITSSSSSVRSRSPSPARPPPCRASPTATATSASPRHSQSMHDNDKSDSEEIIPSKEISGQRTSECDVRNEVETEDLLGFDDVDAPVDQICGTPGPTKSDTAPVIDPTPPVQVKPNSALEDLLCLDPLLGDTGDPVIPVVTPSTTATPAITSDITGLPAGLKPTPVDVLIRPAVVDAALSKKNDPLDLLDSDLVNLASSLGGGTKPDIWNSGSSTAKKK